MVVCQSDIRFCIDGSVSIIRYLFYIDGSVRVRHIFVMMVVCHSDILFVLMVVCQSDIRFCIDGSVSVIRYIFYSDGSVTVRHTFVMMVVYPSDVLFA
jgi:hypothetical protein